MLYAVSYVVALLCHDRDVSAVGKRATSALYFLQYSKISLVGYKLACKLAIDKLGSML